MKFFKAFFAFYINSSVHVAIAVTALVSLTALRENLQLEWSFYAFIFLGVITGYNFVKYAEVAGLHHRSLAKGLKTIQVFSAVCALLLVFVVWQLPLKVMGYTAIFGVLTFFYAVPIIAGSNLRSVSGIKIIVVALVWAGMTVIVPVEATEGVLSFTVWILFFQRFLLVIVWILAFEIRDVKYDLLSLGTMPQQLGVNRTKIVGLVLLFVASLCEFYIAGGQLWRISATMIMLVVTGVLLIKASTAQSRYYASFWVESIPVWWLLFTHLFIQFGP